MKSSSSTKTFTEEIKGTASEVISQVRKLIKEGNARRIMIKNKKGKILFQSQLTVGLAGSTVIAVMAPVISAVGMFALFINDVKIIVERYPAEENGEDGFEVQAESTVIEVEDDDEDDGEEQSSDANGDEEK